jgi:hypothetical protein
MLERTIKESWTMEDVAELQEKLAKLNNVANRKPFYEQCRVVSTLTTTVLQF